MRASKISTTFRVVRHLLRTPFWAQQHFQGAYDGILLGDRAMSDANPWPKPVAKQLKSGQGQTLKWHLGNY